MNFSFLALPLLTPPLSYTQTEDLTHEQKTLLT